MCLTPINLKKETWTQKLQDTYHMQQVPCGSCLECRRLRQNDWYIRLKNEYEHCTAASFVTLTYDDDYLPHTSTGLPTLNYKDHQDFMKVLRKNLFGSGTSNIKYFSVGEYGERSGRPHYHSIMFNCPDTDAIANAWKYGKIHVGNVSDASIYYTLKYALKRAVKIPKNDNGVMLEKALMSKGLGIKFLTPQMIKHYKDDPSRPVTLRDNKKLGLPRYYREKLFTTSEKRERNSKLLTHLDTRLEKISSPLFPQRVEEMYRQAEKKLKETD